MLAIRGTAQLRSRLRRAPETVARAAERQFTAAAHAIERDLKVNSFTARRAAPRGLLRPGGIGGLAVGSGRTRASITTQTFRVTSARQLVAVVGSPIRWLPIHEYGGVIRGNPLLAIPTIYAKRFARYATAVWRSKAGRLFVWALRRRSKPMPVKMLIPSVTIPKRGMFASAVVRTREQVRSILGRIGEIVVRTP